MNFNDWAKKSGERKTSDLLDKLSSAFFKLLDALTIARSRKHIQRYYKDTIAALGGFPIRGKPVSLYPEIDLKGEFMSYDRLNDEIERYQLSLFSPGVYVKDEFKALYEKERVAGFSQAKRENYLIGMMKVNFLKRLESSVHSFDLTLQRTVQKIDDLKARIESFKQFQEENPDFNWNELQVEDDDDEELQDAFEVSKARYKMAHMDLDPWLVDLKGDRDQLHSLELFAREITTERDAKLAKLKALISEEGSAPDHG